MTKSFIRAAILALLLAFPATVLAEDASGIEGLFNVEIRVVLARSVVATELSADENLLVSSTESGARLSIAGATGKITAKRDRQGIKLNNLVFPVRSIRVDSPTGTISFNKKKYRGYMVLWDNERGTFDVVNHLPLEDYLRSVVSMEMPRSWPLEALKAQAIAARTYAMFKRQENSGNYFDVETDVMDQAYGGIAAESETTDAAVSGTAGMVLMYENTIVRAYFHSNAGDRTENGGEVFRSMELPYLKSVPCPYGVNAPSSAWQTSIRLPEIESALSRASLFSGKISDISINSYTKTGRVRQLRIKSRTQNELVEAAAFRLAVGPSRLKSTRFSMHKSGQTVMFRGVGYGHGVGLCQWGAKGMAENKRDYKEILSHYYPGTTITTRLTMPDTE